MFSMTPKHILTILCLALLLLAVPAAADSTDNQTTPLIINPNTPLHYHPHGFTLAEIRESVRAISADTTLRPSEKLMAQTAACGLDNRLQAWLEAERDEETGEPNYGIRIPILTPILATFGLSPDIPDEPYTEDEGRDVWTSYHYVWISSYKPTGSFGGSIE